MWSGVGANSGPNSVLRFHKEVSLRNGRGFKTRETLSSFGRFRSNFRFLNPHVILMG